MQHTLQTAGEQDPRIDAAARLGSALIDEVGLRGAACAAPPHSARLPLAQST
jgi:hypothetical protein